MIILTDTQLLEIRDEVFGPCTVVGECFSAQELREDLLDHAAAAGGVLTRTKLREWLKLRLEVELITQERDNEGRWPDGPTEAQLAKIKVARLVFTRRVTANIRTFMQKL